MKLILHIGGGKCGSSAIQEFLRNNAVRLQSNGVLIPGAQLGLVDDDSGQQVWFFENLVAREDGSQVVFDRLKMLSNHMMKSRLHTLVISAENLMNSGNYERLLAGAPELFDIQVVAYIRRQDEYLISAWQQWYLKAYPSFERYLDDRVGKEANWDQMLEPWEKAFGRDRIAVRRFQRSALINGDVVDDFLASTGLLRDEYVHPEPSNQRLDEHLGTLAHRVRDLFSSEHDIGFFEDMLFAIGPGALSKYRGSILLTLEQRRGVLAAYSGGNEALKKKYFPELKQDEPLFEEPSTDDVVSMDELEQLRCQQDVLVRAIVGLARRVRRLENR